MVSGLHLDHIRNQKQTAHRQLNTNYFQQQQRRAFLSSLLVTSVCLPASAAPPIAVIAEELGYFPVQNKNGNPMYVPARVKRPSTEQAKRLATALHKEGAYMAGTYWCPHTSRQKELFGRTAWSLIDYVECAPQGYQADPVMCRAKQVDGYPTWIFRNGKQLSGERSLSDLANAIGWKGFDETLETNLPVPIGSGSCNLKK
jgi:hypothetical protein